MNRSDAQHFDVAGYALGLLDDRDAALFEEHLAGCDRCADELESFLPVASALAEVDAEAFLAAEATVADGQVLDEMVNAVTYDRSRARAKRAFSLAAGVVALAAAAGIGLYAGGVGDVGRVPQALPSPSDGIKATATAGDLLPGVTAIRATDPTTKVQAAVKLDGRPWGTLLVLELRNVAGPLECQLVAVGPDGFGEVLGTWTVDRAGYGTGANKSPLTIPGSTRVKREDIDRIEVQTVKEGERPGRLVSVDV